MTQRSPFAIPLSAADGDPSEEDFAAAVSGALFANRTLNAGASAPTTTEANMLWYDTSQSTYSVLNIRNRANTDWIRVGVSVVASGEWFPAGAEVSRVRVTTATVVTPPAWARTYEREGEGPAAAGTACPVHSGNSRGRAALGGNAGSWGIKRGLSLDGVLSITLTPGAGGTGVENAKGNDGGNTVFSDGVNPDTIITGGKAQDAPDTVLAPALYAPVIANDACTFVDEERPGAMSSTAFANGNGTRGYATAGQGGASSYGPGGAGGDVRDISGTSADDGADSPNLAAGGGGAVRVSVSGTSTGNTIGGTGGNGWNEVRFYA